MILQVVSLNAPLTYVLKLYGIGNDQAYFIFQILLFGKKECISTL